MVLFKTIFSLCVGRSLSSIESKAKGKGWSFQF